MVEGRHFVHAEVLEALVEDVDAGGFVFLVGGAIGFHDCVGDFHVCEGVEHRGFFAQDFVIVDWGRAVASEFVGDGGVVLVGEVFDCLVGGGLLVIFYG